METIEFSTNVTLFDDNVKCGPIHGGVKERGLIQIILLPVRWCCFPHIMRSVIILLDFGFWIFNGSSVLILAAVHVQESLINAV